MTITEIAAATGVSKTTVSLILNGKAKKFHISDATIARVREFCTLHNFHPNIHAVRMTRNIVGNIMVMLMSGDNEANLFSDSNAAKITGGIIRQAAKYGFSVQVALFDRDSDGEQLFEAFRRREIDGLIAYGWSIPEIWLDTFRKENRAITAVGIAPCPGISTVNIRNFELSYQLTESIIRQNIDRFFYFKGSPASYPGSERFSGFTAALKKNNIQFEPDSMSFTANFSETEAFSIMEKIITSKSLPLPGAICCANDAMALGVLQAVQKHHLNISVAGADNIDAVRFTTPPLKTFDNRPTELGEAAFELLHQTITGKTPVQDLII